MENSTNTYIPQIDVMRAVAFSLVAIAHFSGPPWIDSIHDPNFVERIILSIIQTGWIGVSLFLFLSGYSLSINKTGPGYELNVKQFFINRVLRIFPVWFTCILLLKWSNNLSGTTFWSLVFLNIQDMPPSTAFGLAWSIQLEFFCYMLFPVLLSYLNNRRQLALMYATFLAFRVMLYFVPPDELHKLSYSTIFGCGTVFLSGMVARKFMETNSPIKRRVLSLAPWSIACAIVLLIGLLHFIATHGNYGYPVGRAIANIFLIMPEITSVIFALIVVPYFLRGAANSKGSLANKVGAHVGRVSYSAYMFSLFTLDLFMHVMKEDFNNFSPGGWMPYLTELVMYLALLIGFSTLTFYTIEKPFLSRRHRY